MTRNPLVLWKCTMFSGKLIKECSQVKFLENKSKLFRSLGRQYNPLLSPQMFVECLLCFRCSCSFVQRTTKQMKLLLKEIIQTGIVKLSLKLLPDYNSCMNIVKKYSKRTERKCDLNSSPSKTVLYYKDK